MLEFISFNGESIFKFVERVQKNIESGQHVFAKFKGISLTISKDSYGCDIATIYTLKCALRDIKEY